MSHPTWVRGLKLPEPDEGVGDLESHPTWVRGLKRGDCTRIFLRNKRRTLRGCVD